jgi:hypothetical protein
LFNQILVIKALGTFKIYQAETGELVRQFMVRPIDPMTTRPIHPMKDKTTGLYQPLVVHACLDKVCCSVTYSSLAKGLTFLPLLYPAFV